MDLIGLLRKGSLIHKVLTRTNLQLKRVSPHVLCLVSVQGSLSMACNYHFSCETARGAARGAAAVLHARMYYTDHDALSSHRTCHCTMTMGIMR